jgi:hypothetical protein
MNYGAISVIGNGTSEGKKVFFFSCLPDNQLIMVSEMCPSLATLSIKTLKCVLKTVNWFMQMVSVEFIFVKYSSKLSDGEVYLNNI